MVEGQSPGLRELRGSRPLSLPQPPGAAAGKGSPAREEGVLLAPGLPGAGLRGHSLPRAAPLQSLNGRTIRGRGGGATPREGKRFPHIPSQNSGRNQVQLHSFVSLHYFVELKLLPK